MAQVNNVSTDGILEVQEEIKIRHMNAIVRIQNCFRSWIGLIFGSGRGNDYFYQKWLILKADQQNALEVIFQKVDVDSNNQLDKARSPINIESISSIHNKSWPKYQYKLFCDHEKDEMHDWMHKLERHIMNREVNEHVSTISITFYGALSLVL